MSWLQRAVDEYLQVRRALGFKLQREGTFLHDFVGWLEHAGVSTITTDAAVAWATLPAGASPGWWATRLTAVRSFARWMQAMDPTTEVPPTEVLPVATRRAQPFLYSDHDIGALMLAASMIRSPLRASTYQTLIGLLAVSGLRVGEAIRLNDDDLDWDDGLLVVRDTKFGKSREVPLHHTTLRALRGYAQMRDRCLPHRVTSAFFVSIVGTRLIYKNVHHTFHRLVQQVGLQARSVRCRPRIHDLRHTFAVATLLGWYRAGIDPEQRLMHLSAYLGHLDPHATYWYLHATPQLLTLAAQRLQTAQGGSR